MVPYSIISSLGYFAQRRPWPIVILFGRFFVATAFALMAAAFEDC